ncbi:MAG: hypothetical protein HQM14_16580 [SAR324 cluster bacterium]|nr:hypothetical protein [SAR324 cluster bacterium]
MKKSILFFLAAFFPTILHSQPLHYMDVTPSTDFKCRDRTVKLEVRKGSSNLLFLTTGLTTAATAQYYMTFCISTITTSGFDGLLSIVAVPYIREDIAKGKGEYIRAWLQEMSIPLEKHRAVIMELRKQYPILASQDDLLFSQQIHQIVYDFNNTPYHQRIVIRGHRISEVSLKES